MSFYFIARIKIKDRVEYQKYLDHADAVFGKYKGTYLAVDDQPQLLEGAGEDERIVVIRFKNKSDFQSWYDSYEYQQILQHRLRAAECNTYLVKGTDEI